MEHMSYYLVCSLQLFVNVIKDLDLDRMELIINRTNSTSKM